MTQQFCTIQKPRTAREVAEVQKQTNGRLCLACRPFLAGIIAVLVVAELGWNGWWSWSIDFLLQTHIIKLSTYLKPPTVRFILSGPQTNVWEALQQWWPHA